MQYFCQDRKRAGLFTHLFTELVAITGFIKANGKGPHKLAKRFHNVSFFQSASSVDS